MMNQKVNLFHKDFPSSGLGDRLIDIYLLSVIGYSLPDVDKVLIPWHTFQKQHAHFSVPEYRFIDIQLPNVLSHMSLPHNITPIDTETTTEYTSENPVESVSYVTNGSARWVYDLISDRDLRRFHKENLPDVPYETVVASSNRTLSEFSFTDKTMSLIGDLATEPYASLHIRRTDKVRSARADTTMITSDELNDLNQKTFDAIRYAASVKKINRFYVCTDDVEASQPFVEEIKRLNCFVLSPPEIERWKTTYRDLAMMSKSQVIIQSQTTSVFSNMACLIGNTKLFNVLHHSLDSWV
jgi:hypothetical protein